MVFWIKGYRLSTGCVRLEVLLKLIIPIISKSNLQVIRDYYWIKKEFHIILSILLLGKEGELMLQFRKIIV